MPAKARNTQTSHHFLRQYIDYINTSYYLRFPLFSFHLSLLLFIEKKEKEGGAKRESKEDEYICSSSSEGLGCNKGQVMYIQQGAML